MDSSAVQTFYTRMVKICGCTTQKLLSHQKTHYQRLTSRIQILTIFLLSICFSGFAQTNHIPALDIVEVKYNNVNGNIQVLYSLFDPESDLCTISMSIHPLKGSHQIIMCGNPTGDIGTNIPNGLTKLISCNVDPNLINQTGFRIHLKADDNHQMSIPFLLSQVDTSRIYNTILKLQGKRNRTTDPVFLEKTRQYLKTEFANSETVLFENNFTNLNVPGINYFTTKYGDQQAGRVCMLAAHYDSFGNVPGADDNASGTAGVLEAFRILKNYASNKSIRYGLFDLEEAGLLGSTHYVTNGIPKEDTILGLINFEMIGYYSEAENSQQFPTGFGTLFPAAYQQLVDDKFRGNFITNVANTNSSLLKSAFDLHSKNYVPALKVISLEVPGTGAIVPDLRRSDHAPFWDKNIPAVMLTDGANFRNKYYHTIRDSIQYLNMGFIQHVIQGTIATLVHIAEIDHATSIDHVHLISSANKHADCNTPLHIIIQYNHLKLQFHDCAAQNQQISLFDLQGKTLFRGATTDKDFQIPINEISRNQVYVISGRYAGKNWVRKVYL